MDIYAKATFLSEFLPEKFRQEGSKSTNGFLQNILNIPSKERTNKRYRAFLFRNKKRTIFGLKEFYKDSKTDFRVLATQRSKR